MAYIFEEWTKMLEKFQQCVDKGVEEMHQQKAEVQQIKTDIFNRLDRGAYYRNDERIVISAPEIVIGNVDKSGALNGGETGTVIIKGSAHHPPESGESGYRRARERGLRHVGDRVAGLRHRASQQRCQGRVLSGAFACRSWRYQPACRQAVQYRGGRLCRAA